MSTHRTKAKLMKKKKKKTENELQAMAGGIGPNWQRESKLRVISAAEADARYARRRGQQTEETV